MANHETTMKNILDTLAPAAPPTTITTLQLFGFPLETWVLIGNGLYIVVGLICLLYKTFWRKADGK